ncbi:MAG: hypothetical protein GX834_04785 [Clostridiaceae bacterium]|nr:hypothetical protein [Clostridiaceae bacterium]
MSNNDMCLEALNGRYSEDRLIITDDVDINCKWTLQSILAWMQELGDRHSRILGYDFETLRAKNICWVILRYHIKFISYPRLYDVVKSSSWPEPMRLGIYPRMFLLEDESRTAKIRASSMWSLIDLDERAMVNPAHLGLPVYPVRKIQNFDDLNPLDKIVIPDTEGEIIKYLPVYSDFDMNAHVNNTKYLQWFDNLLSLEEHGKYEVRDLLLHYNLEVLPDVELELKLVRAKDKIYFAVDSEAGSHFKMLALIDRHL